MVVAQLVVARNVEAVRHGNEFRNEQNIADSLNVLLWLVSIVLA